MLKQRGMKVGTEVEPFIIVSQHPAFLLKWWLNPACLKTRESIFTVLDKLPTLQWNAALYSNWSGLSVVSFCSYRNIKQDGGTLPRPQTFDHGLRNQATNSTHAHPRSYPIVHGRQSILIYTPTTLGSSLAPKFIYWHVYNDFILFSPVKIRDISPSLLLCLSRFMILIVPAFLSK